MADRRRQSILKARSLAAQRGQSIFSGEEAFPEVAKENGAWNWALVGPSVHTLSLVGGGAGGVEQMRHVISNQPHAFGLLRMSCRLGDFTHTFVVCVYASDTKNSGACPDALRMHRESAILQFAPHAMKVRIVGQEECCAEFIGDRVSASIEDLYVHWADKASWKSASVGESRDLNKNHAEGMERVLGGEPLDGKLPASLLSGRSSSDDEDFDPTQSWETERMKPQLSGRCDVDLPQRKRVKMYAVGDYVEIWSGKYQNWMDGEVVEIVREPCMKDSVKLRASSVKVLYMKGRRFKWVPPQLVEEHLRASAPVLTGELLKEAHSDGTEWRAVHVELQKGFLQWWVDLDAARRGDASLGHAHLLGLQQGDRADRCFSLRAVGKGGAVDTFKAPREEDAAKWVNLLWEHAGYCAEIGGRKKQHTIRYEFAN